MLMTTYYNEEWNFYGWFLVWVIRCSEIIAVHINYKCNRKYILLEYSIEEVYYKKKKLFDRIFVSSQSYKFKCTKTKYPQYMLTIYLLMEYYSKKKKIPTYLLSYAKDSNSLQFNLNTIGYFKIYYE